MIVVKESALVAAFVGEKVGRGAFVPWGNCSTLGWERGGRLIAGVVYNHYAPPNICMSVGAEGDHWLAPEFLFAAFDYPFRVLDLTRVTGFVDVGNTKSIDFAHRLGFKDEGCLRRALPNGNAQIILGMLKEECKWISEEFTARLAKRLKISTSAI